MQAINEQMKTIYTTLSLDQRTAGSCARRGQAGAESVRRRRRGPHSGGGRGQGGALTPSPELGGRPARARSGLVFVSDSSKTVFHPRIVQLGQGNLDFTEVQTGLKEGERVVMLGALALQAQRQQQQDRAPSERQSAGRSDGAWPWRRSGWSWRRRCGGGGRGGRGG